MVEQIIRAFLSGEMDIVAFRAQYDADPSINLFLQEIIDECLRENRPLLPVPQQGGLPDRDEVCYFSNPESYPGYAYGNRPHGSVREYLTQKGTTNVRTASGAWKFYLRVYDLCYQRDQSLPCLDDGYRAAFEFALDVIPEYLSGGPGEAYIQEHILPLYPDTLPKGQRKKAIKAKIKSEFPSEKGYPAWVQSPEWPMGKNGKPATYLGKQRKKGSELVRFHFRDETDGSLIAVEQFY